MIGRSIFDFWFVHPLDWDPTYTKDQYPDWRRRRIDHGVEILFIKEEQRAICLEGEYKGWIAPLLIGEGRVLNPIPPLELLAREAAE